MAGGSGKRRTIGRPPKFSEPTRVVTLTLPERTIADLARIDADRGRAIVKAVDRTMAQSSAASEHVDLMEVGAGAALITVPFARSLADIEGVHLIEILPARHLVILDPNKAMADVEVELVDRLEDLPEGAQDAGVLNALLDVLRTFRRRERSKLATVIIVETATA